MPNDGGKNKMDRESLNAAINGNLSENASGDSSAPQKLRKNKITDIILTVLVVLLAALLAFVIFAKFFWIGNYPVQGNSMHPAVVNGQTLYGDRLATPKRGDIVVIDAPDLRLLKRIVALPGDTIEARRDVDGLYYIYITPKGQSEAVKERYEGVVLPGIEADHLYYLASGPHLCEGYYAMGDNRNISDDSRSRGTFSADEILAVIKDIGILSIIF